MIKTTLFTLLIGSVFYSTATVSAHPISRNMAHFPVSVTEDVIIQVPLSGDKNHSLITQALNATAGVTYTGKCMEQNLYFIRVDRSLQSNDQFLDQIFSNLSLDFYIKTGTSAQKAISSCDTMTDVATPAAPAEK